MLDPAWSYSMACKARFRCPVFWLDENQTLCAVPRRDGQKIWL